MEEHKKLSLKHDRGLIVKILDDFNTRYIVLFLYIIRKELFQNLDNPTLIDSYNLIMSREEIDKRAVTSGWPLDFIKVLIDLGLIRNIRSLDDLAKKDDDFLLKFGEFIIRVIENTILVPDDVLFLMITKRFKFIKKRDFNLALKRLKGVKCEITPEIHPFIYEIGQGEYALVDDLYDILDNLGNIYRTIKMEDTIEIFYKNFLNLKQKIDNYNDIFALILNRKTTINKLNMLIDEKQDAMKVSDEGKPLFSELSIELKLPNAILTLKISGDFFSQLKNEQQQMVGIDNKLKEFKTYYSTEGKGKSYMGFIEKAPIIDKKLNEDLIALRRQLIRSKTILENIEKEIKIITEIP